MRTAGDNYLNADRFQGGEYSSKENQRIRISDHSNEKKYSYYEFVRD